MPVSAARSDQVAGQGHKALHCKSALLAGAVVLRGTIENKSFCG